MQKMIERYSVGLCAGAIVTIGLLWVMQVVISTDQTPLNEEVSYGELGFIRLLDEVAPVREEQRLKPPPEIDEMPPDLSEPDFTHGHEDAIFHLYKLEVTADGGIEVVLGGYSSDVEYEPIFTVAPIYPRHVFQLELEGWVIVEFEVTETGNVENVVVIDAEPKGVFDSAARKAAEKFRFRPRVVNEQPIRVKGVKYKFTFELEDA